MDENDVNSPSCARDLVIARLTMHHETVLGDANKKPVNSMLITGTITAKQKVRQKVPGLYAVCR